MFLGDHVCFLDKWCVHFGLMRLRMSFSRKVLITLKKKKDYVSIPGGIYSLVTIILGGKH